MYRSVKMLCQVDCMFVVVVVVVVVFCFCFVLFFVLI